MAPYRPQGPGVQAMVYKSLVAEWSLFHSMPLIGKRLLDIQEPFLPQARQRTVPLSPVLCRHQQVISNEPLSACGTGYTSLPSLRVEEGAHGGHFDSTASDKETFSILSCEEIIAIDECASLPDILQGYTTDYDLMILSDGREPEDTPNHSKEALVHDVITHAISEVWASCVIPVLEPLVPSQGVMLVDHQVRSSTTNSIATESSDKNTSSCLHSKRPHTGEPRAVASQPQSIIWVPEKESDHPQENLYGISQDDLNDDEVCVYRTPPLPNGEEFNLNMNIVGVSGLGLDQEQSTSNRRKEKNKRKSEKRRQRKQQKELQQQQNRITEYVAEQTAIRDLRQERGTPDLSLPPLYETEVKCDSSSRREPSSRDVKRKPSNPPSPPVDKESKITQDREVPQPGIPTGYSRESLCLPLLCSKQTANPRYDWPTRAQTAIPSHARTLRIRQQFPS